MTVDSIARRQSGEFATDCGSQALSAQTVVLATRDRHGRVSLRGLGFAARIRWAFLERACA